MAEFEGMEEMICTAGSSCVIPEVDWVGNILLFNSGEDELKLLVWAHEHRTRLEDVCAHFCWMK